MRYLFGADVKIQIDMRIKDVEEEGGKNSDTKTGTKKETRKLEPQQEQGKRMNKNGTLRAGQGRGRGEGGGRREEDEEENEKED